MKISNNVNNTTLIITKNASKVQEEKRAEDEISENLGEKMYDAVFSFKEKYAMFHSNMDNLS